MTNKNTGNHALYLNRQEIYLPTFGLTKVKDEPFSIEGWFILLHPTDFGKIIDTKIHYLRQFEGHWLFGYATSPTGSNDDVWYYVASPQRVQIDEAVHVAGVYDLKSLRLYVNGKKVVERQASLKPFGRDGIGGIGYSQGFWGVIDELRISNIARYDADFTPEQRFQPDASTIALYHCDEGQGIRLLDSSGNGHHALIARGEVQWVDDLFTAPEAQRTIQIKLKNYSSKKSTEQKGPTRRIPRMKTFENATRNF